MIYKQEQCGEISPSFFKGVNMTKISSQKND